MYSGCVSNLQTGSGIFQTANVLAPPKVSKLKHKLWYLSIKYLVYIFFFYVSLMSIIQWGNELLVKLSVYKKEHYGAWKEFAPLAAH